jgi:hypothetical protein
MSKVNSSLNRKRKASRNVTLRGAEECRSLPHGLSLSPFRAAAAALNCHPSSLRPCQLCQLLHRTARKSHRRWRCIALEAAIIFEKAGAGSLNPAMLGAVTFGGPDLRLRLRGQAGCQGNLARHGLSCLSLPSLNVERKQMNGDEHHHHERGSINFHEGELLLVCLYVSP